MRILNLPHRRRRLLAIAIAGVSSLIVASCSAPYQSRATYDPMTGETVRHVPYVRLRAVSGHATGGQQLLTGTSTGLFMSDVTIGEGYVTLSVAFSSSYRAGLLGRGQQSGCVDTVLRMNLGGDLVEIAPTGPVLTQGIVTQQSWGQPTAGAGSTSQQFTLEGAEFELLMATRSAVIEYCNLVSEIDIRSLAAIQGRAAGTQSSGGGGQWSGSD
jgi:hypothetical protein